MKTVFVLQILTVLLCQYETIDALYGFGVPRQPPYLPRQLVVHPLQGPHNLKTGGQYFGGYLGGYAPSYPAIKPKLVVPFGKMLRPVVLLPNGPWQGRPNYQRAEDVKPVTEDLPGDYKYDFRTKTHSIR